MRYFRSKFFFYALIFSIVLGCQSRKFGDVTTDIKKTSKAETDERLEALTMPKTVNSFSMASFEKGLNEKLETGVSKVYEVLEHKKITTDDTCRIQFGSKEKNLESPSFILDREFHPSNFAFALAFGAYDTSWEPKAMEDQLRRWGFDNVKFLYENNWGLHAFVAWNKTFAVLHYRGTYNLGGAALDGMFKEVRPDEMKDQNDPSFRGAVHFGFWRAFMALRDQVRTALDEATQENPNLPITVSGHSLGGATALLASLDILHEKKNFVSVYTTAQPRVGNEIFAASVNEKIGKSYFRLVLKGDVVSHVPPTKDGLKSFSNAWSFFSWMFSWVPHVMMNKGTYSHAGRVFVFENPNAQFSEDLRSDVDQDKAFWEERAKKFTMGGFMYHPPLFYLCHFAAIYNEKIRNWGVN